MDTWLPWLPCLLDYTFLGLSSGRTERDIQYPWDIVMNLTIW